ncbi:alpha/beta fold hydrolase [Nocardia colli]|uniref:Alpha/beta fold hydrolase n=1 Tax=Nocardia colli TaxID=2545717 RepID=A0A5N0EJW9_9NOCA|nr:alpha/beta fold hydrolase [Nocardia colli]KAA8889303.1 alpha/beta fold hydrolase [Nocardia colli]
MKRRTSSRASIVAVLLGVTALVLGVAGPGAHAAPSVESIEQRIADRIDGRGRGTAITDYGFSAGLSGGFASDTVGSGPAQPSWLSAFGYGLFHPDAAPPGANDWNCKPTAEHRRPVVLLHGTWMNAYNSFAFMSQPIKDAGFCTFAFNYGRADPAQGGGLPPLLPGVMGTGNIEDSAKQLATFVDRVLAATGAPAVDLIGYSQGGAMANWYTKFEGGADKVHNLITFGATHHGSTIDGIAALGRAVNTIGIDVVGASSIVVGHAVAEQTIGSDFVNRLNAGGDTISGIDYTIVGTRYDEIMTPYNLTFLRPGGGASVQNVTLQDGCELDLSDHQTLMYSPRALSIALRALDPAGHPDLACTFNPWLIGGGGHL